MNILVIWLRSINLRFKPDRKENRFSKQTFEQDRIKMSIRASTFYSSAGQKKISYFFILNTPKKFNMFKATHYYTVSINPSINSTDDPQNVLLNSGKQSSAYMYSD